MTSNYEKIKNMSIEEMSKNIKNMFCDLYHTCEVCPINYIIHEHLEEQPISCVEYLEKLLGTEYAE